MASIRERVDASGKKSFHVQIRLQGFPPQTKTFDTKTEAKRWAQYVETELRAGRYMPLARAQRRTVKDMLEEYRLRVLIPLKPKRVRDQGPQLDWWIKKIGHYSLADITAEPIGRARDELLTKPIPSPAKQQPADGDGSVMVKGKPKLRAPATAVRYMAVLSHAFNVAVKEWEWLPSSPMTKVKKPKVANGRVRYLTADELERLRAAARLSANRYLAPAIEIAVATGMRHGEMMGLRWRDVLIEDDDEHALILLEETKNGERRGVPLTGQGLVAFKTLRDMHRQANRGTVKADELLFPSAAKPKPDEKPKAMELRSSWNTALTKAGIKDFRFHDLRHTTASYLAMNGATAPEIAEVLGHKDLQMVKRYSHLSKAHITGVLSRMNASMLGAESGKQPGEADEATPIS